MNKRIKFVHTFELFCVPNKEIKRICKTFKREPKEEIINGITIRYSIYYKSNKNGISYLYSSMHEKYNLGYLRIKVNIPKLLKNRFFRNNIEEYEEIEKLIITDYKKEFNIIINKLPVLSRIDFKIDAYLDKDARERYIKLLKKSYAKFGYMIKDESYITSAYLKGKSTTINIYDKVAEQIAKGTSKNIIESGVYDFIRLEVQVQRQHIRYKKTRNIADELRQYYSIEKRDKTLEDYIRPIIFKGNHYNARQARKLISKNYTPYMTDRLMSLLGTVSKYGVEKAKKEYHSSYYYYRKLLSDVGINLILVPKQWGIKHLPNLLDLGYSQEADKGGYEC